MILTCLAALIQIAIRDIPLQRLFVFIESQNLNVLRSCRFVFRVALKKRRKLMRLHCRAGRMNFESIDC